MKYKPHDYQRFATDYIENHPIAAILLDMGFDKTSITLTVLSNLLFDSFEIHKILVIAPLRVASVTWSSEIEKWEHLHLLQYSLAVSTGGYLHHQSALSLPLGKMKSKYRLKHSL